MENDLRTSDKTQKGKIHSTSVDAENITENKTNLSNLQGRLDRHEAMLQQVMHGIAELTRTGPTKNSLIKKCWHHDTDGHEIGDCVAFKQLDLKRKFDVLRKNGGCYFSTWQQMIKTKQLLFVFFMLFITILCM